MKFEEFVEKVFVPNLIKEHSGNLLVYGQEIGESLIVACKKKQKKVFSKSYIPIRYSEIITIPIWVTD